MYSIDIFIFLPLIHDGVSSWKGLLFNKCGDKSISFVVVVAWFHLFPFNSFKNKWPKIYKETNNNNNNPSREGTFLIQKKIQTNFCPKSWVFWDLLTRLDLHIKIIWYKIQDVWSDLKECFDLGEDLFSISVFQTIFPFARFDALYQYQLMLPLKYIRYAFNTYFRHVYYNTTVVK